MLPKDLSNAENTSKWNLRDRLHAKVEENRKIRSQRPEKKKKYTNTKYLRLQQVLASKWRSRDSGDQWRKGRGRALLGEHRDQIVYPGRAIQHTQWFDAIQAILGLLALDESVHSGFRLSFSPSRIWSKLTSHHGSMLSMLQRTICDDTSPLQLGQWLGAQPAASLARSRANADEAKLWGREKLKGWPSLPDFVPPSYRWVLQAGTHLRRVNCAETLHGLIQSQSGEW